jgi:hypothetical protein
MTLRYSHKAIIRKVHHDNIPGAAVGLEQEDYMCTNASVCMYLCMYVCECVYGNVYDNVFLIEGMSNAIRLGRS